MLDVLFDNCGVDVIREMIQSFTVKKGMYNKIRVKSILFFEGANGVVVCIIIIIVITLYDLVFTIMK